MERVRQGCCGPIFVAGTAHSDGSHVTTSANCGNNATKVSWETHTKLHALRLKGRGGKREQSKGLGTGLTEHEGVKVTESRWHWLATRRRRQSLAAPSALGCISFSIFRNTLQHVGYTVALGSTIVVCLKGFFGQKCKWILRRFWCAYLAVFWPDWQLNFTPFVFTVSFVYFAAQLICAFGLLTIFEGI